MLSGGDKTQWKLGLSGHRIDPPGRFANVDNPRMVTKFAADGSELRHLGNFVLFPDKRRVPHV
jgi:hypothetical protein